MSTNALTVYESAIKRFINYCGNKLITQIDTDDVRLAHNKYKEETSCSDLTLDTFRRISAIFA